MKPKQGGSRTTKNAELGTQVLVQNELAAAQPCIGFDLQAHGALVMSVRAREARLQGT